MPGNAEIEELEQKFGDNPRRYFAALANAYRRRGDLDRAIDLCRVQLAQQPAHLSGHVVLGQALFDAGRRAEARDELQYALELDPENFIALRLLGELSAAEGDRESARSLFARALDIEPRNEQVLSAVAELDAEVELPSYVAHVVAETAAAAAEPVAETAAEPPRYDSPPDDDRFDLADAAVVAAEPATWVGEVETADYEAPVGVEPPETILAHEAAEPPEPAADELVPAEMSGDIADDAEDLVEAVEPTDGFAEPATVSTDSGRILLSETMADLYLQQGHRAEAADVIRQLLDQRPDDERLQRRLAELATPRATVRDLFARVATARAPRSAAGPGALSEFFGDRSQPRPTRADRILAAVGSQRSARSAAELDDWLTELRSR